MIEKNTGHTLVIEDLDLDADQKTYDLLARGDTLGVFQLDGGPMRSLLRQLKPTNFEDISAVIALYRPGPMGMESHTKYALRKNGLQVIDAIHPELEEPLREILAVTYGVIVYQEQVMAAAQKVAGYTLGQADILRKAMGKKDKKVLDKQREGFEAGMKANGYSAKAVDTLWETLMPFADYAFNKAHSAGYGVLSYWTAYLKANYPAEYMAALLTSVGDSKDKLGMYLNECRRMGIKVLAPDVNESFVDFTAVPVRRPASATSASGSAPSATSATTWSRASGWLAKRRAGSSRSTTSWPRCRSRSRTSARSSRSSRRAHSTRWARPAVRCSRSTKTRSKAPSASSARRPPGRPVSTSTACSTSRRMPGAFRIRPEWSKKDKLAFEREMLGLYVSDHPLAGLESQLAKHASLSITELLAGEAASDGETVTIAGLLTSVQHRTARQSGNQYGMVTVEDFGGEITVMFMGKTYQEFAPALASDSIVVIKGRVSVRDDGMNLHAVSMFAPDVGASLGSGPLVISVPEFRATTDVVSQLNDVLIRHSGENEVRLKLVRGETARMFEIPYPVTVSADLYGELKSLLGPSCLN